MQKIVPHLWFNDQAEEAVKFYTSIFKNSKIGTIAHYGESGAHVSGMPKGSVMTIDFKLEGQDFIALNGGPHFKFSPAISLLVNCETQEEIDALWSQLSALPQAEQCGWLQDKYGLSWQIVPAVISQYVSNPETSERVMSAILKMKKIDINAIKQAVRG